MYFKQSPPRALLSACFCFDDGASRLRDFLSRTSSGCRRDAGKEFVASGKWLDEVEVKLDATSVIHWVRMEQHRRVRRTRNGFSRLPLIFEDKNCPLNRKVNQESSRHFSPEWMCRGVSLVTRSISSSVVSQVISSRFFHVERLFSVVCYRGFQCPSWNQPPACAHACFFVTLKNSVNSPAVLGYINSTVCLLVVIHFIAALGNVYVPVERRIFIFLSLLLAHRCLCRHFLVIAFASVFHVALLSFVSCTVMSSWRAKRYVYAQI